MIKSNKKAVSEIIATVLLIGMSLMMAGAVYAWMKSIASQPMAEEVCPDDISLIINSYSCVDGIMSLTVRNKGFFNVSGYIAKINNVARTEDTLVGKYPLCTEAAVNNYTHLPCNTEFTYNGCAAVPAGMCNIKIANPTTIKFTNPLIPNALSTNRFNYSEYGKIMQIEIEPMRGEDLCKNRVITQAVQNCPLITG